MVRTLEPAGTSENEPAGDLNSELRQWPVKLQLLGPQASFLKGADLLLMADCVAVAFPDLHRKIIKGHALAIGCPKLDDLDAHIQRLADILEGARPKSLTVGHMEVPCCRGFVRAAEQAIKKSDLVIPFGRIQVGVNGEIQEREDLDSAGLLKSTG
jgi:hypothetical protein